MFSDSWIEQGGKFSQASTATNSYYTVTFPHIMQNNWYYNNVVTTNGGTSGWQYWGGTWIGTLTVNNMIVGHSLGNTTSATFTWFVTGY